MRAGTVHIDTTDATIDTLGRHILQRGVRLGDEGLEVRLEPGTGLGRGLRGVGERARRVVARRRRVRGTVGLASGLDPDDRVDERVARVRRRADTEAGALDVAPVAPLLAEVLLAGAALVDDELRGEAGGREHRPERVDVVRLVVVRVALRDRVGRGGGERVVVGDVGREPADELGRVRGLVHLREERGRGLDVRGPAEPAGVAGVHVAVDADGGELLEGVGDARLVGGLGVGALLHVQVRDEVRERVGLDDRDDAHVGVLLDLRDDLVDVVVVLLLAAVGDAELSVGGLRGAVTVGQVVDDDLDELLLAGAVLDRGGICEVGTEVRDLRNLVEPSESWDVRDARGLGSEGGVGDVGSGSLDLSCVVGAQVGLN